MVQMASFNSWIIIFQAIPRNVHYHGLPHTFHWTALGLLSSKKVHTVAWAWWGIFRKMILEHSCFINILNWQLLLYMIVVKFVGRTWRFGLSVHLANGRICDNRLEIHGFLFSRPTHLLILIDLIFVKKLFFFKFVCHPFKFKNTLVSPQLQTNCFNYLFTLLRQLIILFHTQTRFRHIRGLLYINQLGLLQTDE